MKQVTQSDSPEVRALDGLTEYIRLIVAEEIRPLREELHAAKNQDNHMDVKTVAQLINRSRKTVYDLVHKKKIPFHKAKTGALSFRHSEIVAWLDGK